MFTWPTMVMLMQLSKCSLNSRFTVMKLKNTSHSQTHWTLAMYLKPSRLQLREHLQNKRMQVMKQVHHHRRHPRVPLPTLLYHPPPDLMSPSDVKF
ncbi:hypothetical protein F2Q68_00018854 [Brassica cretica]|uniref:Uncharacterized protein n=1 Tax=Brassica cretica TaxID=69181 RepID=A0A8S9G679_BRACR|nr:hypothetical protein F2Q68_00018854 [Brassica cretica]